MWPSDWTTNSSSGLPLLPSLANLTDELAWNDTITNSSQLTLNNSCLEASSSPTRTEDTATNSLDALLYIIIVLLFYSFSIVVLMIKYVRREREEAHLRSYYYEFVARDKFRSAQYRNQQFMRRLFCRGEPRDSQSFSPGERDDRGTNGIITDVLNHPNTVETTDSLSPLNKLLSYNHGGNCSIPGVRPQFCRKSLLGKKCHNKQWCSKCVSESAPTIDWGDGRIERQDDGMQRHSGVDMSADVSFTRFPDWKSHGFRKGKINSPKCYSETSLTRDRDNSIFLPILECDSDVENDEGLKQKAPVKKWDTANVLVHVSSRRPFDDAAVVSCSSLDSPYLLHMPHVELPNDLDTLDGLSNFDSEAGSQSLLSYSASIRGANGFPGGPPNKDSPGVINRSSGCGEDRVRDLSDFLSERTSLLSCTLSIEDGDDEDATTNQSSCKPHPYGLSLPSSCSSKVKEDTKSHRRALFSPVSKSLSTSGDEGRKKKILADKTNLTDESSILKNLKYFLRGFSKDPHMKEVYETLESAPRETHFDADASNSPEHEQSTQPSKCNLLAQTSAFSDMNAVCDNLLTIDHPADLSDQWTDTEDGLSSEGNRSSSCFGDYFLGEPSQSQVIDLSQPLVRRQLDSQTRNILSRAFLGLNDPASEYHDEGDFTGQETARRETNV